MCLSLPLAAFSETIHHPLTYPYYDFDGRLSLHLGLSISHADIQDVVMMHTIKQNSVCRPLSHIHVQYLVCATWMMVKHLSSHLFGQSEGLSLKKGSASILSAELGEVQKVLTVQNTPQKLGRMSTDPK